MIAARPFPRQLSRPLLIVALSLGLAAPGTVARGLEVGDPVAISGVVTDSGGRPLSGVTIVFEHARSAFRVRGLRREENDLRRSVAVTDGRGSYTISWPFDPYFNRFEIQAGISLRKGREDRFEVLERQTLTARALRAGAVVVPFVVHDGARLARLRSFEAGLATDDERRVYAEVGQPDEIRIVEFPDHREVTWWYFESGRAYRFESGRLAQVVPFEPVRN